MSTCLAFERCPQVLSPPSTNCITGVSLANTGTLAAGSDAATTCVVTNTTGVVCWGSNFYGQLGNGFSNSTTVSTPPANSPVLYGAVAVTVGFSHVCALMNTTGYRFVPALGLSLPVIYFLFSIGFN